MTYQCIAMECINIEDSYISPFQERRAITRAHTRLGSFRRVIHRMRKKTLNYFFENFNLSTTKF